MTAREAAFLAVVFGSTSGATLWALWPGGDDLRRSRWRELSRRVWRQGSRSGDSPGPSARLSLRGLLRYPGRAAPRGLLLSCLCGAVAGGVLGLLAAGTRGLVPGAMLGAGAPLAWKRRESATRAAAVERQLPDVLSALAASLRAGHSLLQATEVASRETGPPLGAELRRFVQETQLNVPVEEALRHLGERVPSRDLQLAVVAVIIQREAGGNLAQLMDEVAATVRERLRLRAEIRTLTAQGRLSGAVIGALPAVLALLISRLSPGYLGVLTGTPPGRLLLTVAVCLWAAGFIIMRRLAHPDI